MSGLRCVGCGTTEDVAARYFSKAKTRQVCRSCWEKNGPRWRANDLLTRVVREVRRYVVIGEAEGTALALFVAHTWAFDAADATPYLLILSPERRSGKTRLLEVLGLICARAWHVIEPSQAVLFRKLAAHRPTVLLDEVDAVFGSRSERTQPLRAVLNAGNRTGAVVPRCVGEKGDEVRDFEVFSPKVLAGIDTGRLPDTIRDRSIRLPMRRRTKAEPVERFRVRHAKGPLDDLAADLKYWADFVVPDLEDAEPELPDALNDRAADAWEPLLAIADLAGGEWPRRARDAAERLSSDEPGEVSRGAMLLAAIREVFGAQDRITTATLLAVINADEELPFGGWSEGKGLDSRGLARMLRVYEITPRTIRVGDNPNHRGYLREQFVDAWERWTPIPEQAPQAPQAPQAIGAAADRPLDQAVVADVADVAANPKGGVDVADNGHRAEDELPQLGLPAYDDEDGS